MWSMGEAPGGSLLSEGSAMRNALVEDFLDAGLCVVTTQDVRLGESAADPCQAFRVDTVRSAEDERQLIAEHASASDWTLIVAPESDGVLVRRVQWAEHHGARLLGLSSELCELFSNKHETANWLSRRGIQTTVGQLVDSTDRQFPQGVAVPSVCKPNDGAGSVGVFTVEDPSIWSPPSSPHRLETRCQGDSASISLLCGKHGHAPLPCVYQHLSDDGCFQYRGGALPVSPSFQLRAKSLALEVADHLPPSARGLVGIDLVLAEQADNDVIVEVNPRVTTSYVGLRQACRSNLASAMIASAEGQQPRLDFDLSERIEFSPSQ